MRIIARCPPSGGGYFAPTDPTINIDLTQETLDPRIIFSRTSGRTYFDKNGIMQVAAANEWPVEYDPVTGECLGRSVWGQSTNIVPNSVYGEKAWGDPTLTEDTETVCPDGSTKSYYADFSKGPSGVNACESITLGSFSQQQKYIFSFYLKTIGHVDLYIINHSSEGTEEGLYYIGYVESPGSFRRFTLPANADHYYACTLRVQTGSGAKAWFWGCQFESGEVATPYIPTSGGAATRAYDSAYVALPSQDVYSAMAEIYLGRKPGTFGNSCYAIGTCSLDGLSRMVAARTENADSGNADLLVSDTTNKTTISSGLAWTDGGYSKILITARQSLYQLAMRGGSVSIKGITAQTVTRPTLSIGNYTPSGPGNPLNGWIRSVKLWGRELSQTEMIGATS